MNKTDNLNNGVNEINVHDKSENNNQNVIFILTLVESNAREDSS